MNPREAIKQKTKKQNKGVQYRCELYYREDGKDFKVNYCDGWIEITIEGKTTKVQTWGPEEKQVIKELKKLGFKRP